LIIKVKDQSQLYSSLDEIGLKEEIEKHKSVLIKINLARPAKVEHPRTDPFLISETIKYIKQNQGTCAIAESANGYLRQNLGILGLDDIIGEFEFKNILVGDNALELDLYVLNNVFTNHEIPDYIKRLQLFKVCNK
jgi:hypothetical protein